MVRSPWIPGGHAPSINTAVIIPAHPAAVMLGVVASRLAAAFGHVNLAATVLEPASQQGNSGLDEMHQQTVSLLGFHSLPQEVYDAQVAFNLRIGVGEAAKLDMSTIASDHPPPPQSNRGRIDRILHHVATCAGSRLSRLHHVRLRAVPRAYKRHRDPPRSPRRRD